MKKIILFIALLVLASFAYAQDDVVSQLNELSSEYKGQQMPKPFAMIFGNERINVHIDDAKVSVVTQEGVMTSFKQGHLDDPTMNVYLSEATLNKILNSDNPGEAVKNALKNKEITYKGVGVGKSIKLFFVKIGAKIASWFI